MKLNTPATELLGIDHPVVLGGMGFGTCPELVAAVSNAGGLGIQGCSGRPPEVVAALAHDIRELSDRPFGLNLLLFMSEQAAIDAVLEARPAVFSTAWPWPEQELAPLFERAHSAGALVMHMVSNVPEAVLAAQAGADIIVAQGTDGGGHVGTIGTMVLTPMVARAVAPLPVLAAGGIADGAGLAAALMLGAAGVLLGTRFLATPESNWPPSFKEAIVASDGHDTLLTEIPDIAKATVWPGAFDRTRRNRLIEEWAGRENEVRRRRHKIGGQMREAAAKDDASYGELNFSQAAGLIDRIEPAASVVARIVREAELRLESPV